LEVLVKVVGIQMANFRSIGNPGVFLEPLKACNILVGQNNAGKSNVIRAVQKISASLRNLSPQRTHTEAGTLDPLDYHQRDPRNEFTFRVIFQAGDSDSDQQVAKAAGTDHFDFSFIGAADGTQPRITDFSLMHLTDFKKANDALGVLINYEFTRYSTHQDIFNEFKGKADIIFRNRFAQDVPQVTVIPEFRRIQSGERYSLEGTNLIGLLGRYQNPEIGYDRDRRKFELIEDFVRRLLHLPGAELEVTRETQTIVLSHNGLRLPLASYGTGVHQLVIMVTAVLSVEGALCCIEEPEIHLHPTLQREFLEFITTETNNTYLLSTHSPTFINAQNKMPARTRENIGVIHLHRTDGNTVGGPVLEDIQSLAALRDLGVSASDILQANSVIWVEGPSDRIYLNQWIHLMDPDLVEGLHYSIMFYGGRLLSHLSVARGTAANLGPKVPLELVDILRINQHAVVVIDSDRKAIGQRISQTKQRVRVECETSGGLCWITDGREIENYLAVSTVVRTCETELGVTINFMERPFEDFEDTLDDALKAAKQKPWRYADRKVFYARKFAAHLTETDMSPQLRKRVSEIVDAIVAWNR
jgi:hypothetical protein